MSTVVDILPDRERHVRELCRIESDAEAAEVWAEVLETVENDRHIRTLTHRRGVAGVIGPGTHRGVKTHARRSVVHHPDLLALMDKSPPPNRGRGRPKKAEENNAARHFNRGSNGTGNHTATLAARLATDHPEHYEGFRNGTYKSVRASKEKPLAR